MSYKLTPQEGRPYLVWHEAIARFAEHFAYVSIDRHRGAEQADRIMDRLKEIDAPAEAIDALLARRGHAASVTVADDLASKTAFLSFLLMPDREIYIAYFSADHERDSAPLLAKLAAALEYEVVETS
ncbi:MAG: hypothetical protein GC159_10995 [Phycisphaera sp.]|nr:hypothetical protein [Phycisphaera sp.]